MQGGDSPSGSGKRRAPSRQPHSCPQCGVVFSRAEFARRHYLAKHAPKPLACSECEATFSRRDLLQRHVKLFHPDCDVPVPDAAPEPDIPAPIPVPSRSESAISYTSSTGDGAASTSSGMLLGDLISASPEPMQAPTLPDDMRLPTPPPASMLGQQASTSSSQRTVTYPPPSFPLQNPPTYQAYPLPSLPPSSIPTTPYTMRGLSTSTQSSFSSAGGSLGGGGGGPSVPGPYRAYTAPAGYDPLLHLQQAQGQQPQQPPAARLYSHAAVQTDLRAHQVPAVGVGAYPHAPHPHPQRYSPYHFPLHAHAHAMPHAAQQLFHPQANAAAGQQQQAGQAETSQSPYSPGVDALSLLLQHVNPDGSSSSGGAEPSTAPAAAGIGVGSPNAASVVPGSTSSATASPAPAASSAHGAGSPVQRNSGAGAGAAAAAAAGLDLATLQAFGWMQPADAHHHLGAGGVAAAVPTTIGGSVGAAASLESPSPRPWG